jgi:lysophospholipase L1-like esterase
VLPRARRLRVPALLEEVEVTRPAVDFIRTNSRRISTVIWFFVLLAPAVPVAITTADAGADTSRWIGTWAAAPQAFMPGSLAQFRNQTLRLIVHTSVGGTAIRIHISNTYGNRPLIIGSAHVAQRASGANVNIASDREVTFNSKRYVTVAKGATVVSDGVKFAVPALSDLAISLFLPDDTAATTSHFLARQTSYVSADTGDSTGTEKLKVGKTLDSWPFLTAVDVTASDRAATIVVFGDSLVDGDGSTSDTNRRWTDILAARLQQQSRAVSFGVLNEGIIGNRLLRDSPRDSPNEFGDALGESGLKRFARDALGPPSVTLVIARLGVNDLGFPGAFTPATESVTARDLIAGYRKIIEMAHRHGVRIIGTTITPFEGTTTAPGYYTPEKEAARQVVNSWLRKNHEFDGIVDLDQVLRDPEHAARLVPAYDSGDHLHTNDVGYAAAASAVPLALFGTRALAEQDRDIE